MMPTSSSAARIESKGPGDKFSRDMLFCHQTMQDECNGHDDVVEVIEAKGAKKRSASKSTESLKGEWKKHKVTASAGNPSKSTSKARHRLALLPWLRSCSTTTTAEIIEQKRPAGVPMRPSLSCAYTVFFRDEQRKLLLAATKEQRTLEELVVVKKNQRKKQEEQHGAGMENEPASNLVVQTLGRLWNTANVETKQKYQRQAQDEKYKYQQRVMLLKRRKQQGQDCSSSLLQHPHDHHHQQDPHVTSSFQEHDAVSCPSSASGPTKGLQEAKADRRQCRDTFTSSFVGGNKYPDEIQMEKATRTIARRIDECFAPRGPMDQDTAAGPLERHIGMANHYAEHEEKYLPSLLQQHRSLPLLSPPTPPEQQDAVHLMAVELLGLLHNTSRSSSATTRSNTTTNLASNHFSASFLSRSDLLAIGREQQGLGRAGTAFSSSSQEEQFRLPLLRAPNNRHGGAVKPASLSSTGLHDCHNPFPPALLNTMSNSSTMEGNNHGAMEGNNHGVHVGSLLAATTPSCFSSAAFLRNNAAELGRAVPEEILQMLDSSPSSSWPSTAATTDKARATVQTEASFSGEHKEPRNASNGLQDNTIRTTPAEQSRLFSTCGDPTAFGASYGLVCKQELHTKNATPSCQADLRINPAVAAPNLKRAASFSSPSSEPRRREGEYNSVLETKKSASVSNGCVSRTTHKPWGRFSSLAEPSMIAILAKELDEESIDVLISLFVRKEGNHEGSAGRSDEDYDVLSTRA